MKKNGKAHQRVAEQLSVWTEQIGARLLHRPITVIELEDLADTSRAQELEDHMLPQVPTSEAQRVPIERSV